MMFNFFLFHSKTVGLSLWAIWVPRKIHIAAPSSFWKKLKQCKFLNYDLKETVLSFYTCFSVANKKWVKKLKIRQLVREAQFHRVLRNFFKLLTTFLFLRQTRPFEFFIAREAGRVCSRKFLFFYRHRGLQTAQ